MVNKKHKISMEFIIFMNTREKIYKYLDDITNYYYTIIKNDIKIMKYGGTAYNRSVYASPPIGGSGSEKPQSGFALGAVFSPPQFGQGQCYGLPYNLPKPS